MIVLVSDLYGKFGLSVQVTERMKRRTVAGITALLDDMAAQTAEKAESTHKASAWPMTANQLGIYFDCVAHPDSVGYHLSNAIRFDHSINPERLRDAVVKAVSHHVLGVGNVLDYAKRNGAEAYTHLHHQHRRRDPAGRQA